MNAMHTSYKRHCIAGDAEQWRPADQVLLHKICHYCMECECIDHYRGYRQQATVAIPAFLLQRNCCSKSPKDGMRPRYLLLVPASL